VDGSGNFSKAKFPAQTPIPLNQEIGVMNTPKGNPLHTATITSLSHEGRGIARIDNKTTFIQGALPGETVEFYYTRKHNRFDEGMATQIRQPLSDRVSPGCDYFGVCGGCSLQHMSSQAQIHHKESLLQERLHHIAHTKPLNLMPAIPSQPWGYRHRARLHVAYHPENHTISIGFLQQNSHQIVEIASCPILEKRLNNLITILPDFLLSLDGRSSIFAINLISTDSMCSLGLHQWQLPNHRDQERFAKFAKNNSCHVYWIIEKKHSKKSNQDFHERLEAKTLTATMPVDLEYAIDQHTIRIQFQPNHFTQINPQMNLKMIEKAIELLKPNSNDTILDLFCGVGNFTLPLARYASSVVGVEGNASSVLQAKKNAQLNQLFNASFFTDNLFKPNHQSTWSKGVYNKIIIDPPRAGAKEMIPWIVQCQPTHILYIACDTATLARDIHLFLAEGYRLSQAGVIDMFPHTEHTEAIALLLSHDVPGE
jgi:23S rRNA (uracil1939-C5)-methyltransferase